MSTHGYLLLRVLSPGKGCARILARTTSLLRDVVVEVSVVVELVGLSTAARDGFRALGRGDVSQIYGTNGTVI